MYFPKIFNIILVLLFIILTTGCASVPAKQSINEPEQYVNQNGTGWITIDPINDKHIGDRFTITAKTNLSAGEEIRGETVSILFQRTARAFDRNNWSGATGDVMVKQGNDSVNIISFDIDSVNFKPATHSMTFYAINQNVSCTTFYNMLPKIKDSRKN
jgi:hypothetical protein